MSMVKVRYRYVQPAAEYHVDTDSLNQYGELKKAPYDGHVRDCVTDWIRQDNGPQLEINQDDLKAVEAAAFPKP